MIATFKLLITPPHVVLLVLILVIVIYVLARLAVAVGNREAVRDDTERDTYSF